LFNTKFINSTHLVFFSVLRGVRSYNFQTEFISPQQHLPSNQCCPLYSSLLGN